MESTLAESSDAAADAEYQSLPQATREHVSLAEYRASKAPARRRWRRYHLQVPLSAARALESGSTAESPRMEMSSQSSLAGTSRSVASSASAEKRVRTSTPTSSGCHQDCGGAGHHALSELEKMQVLDEHINFEDNIVTSGALAVGLCM